MMTLYLPLKKEWYNMIESGEKKEEYREINNYWASRLLHRHIQQFKLFEAVRFSYGYTNRTMTYKIESLRIGKGKPEWGAPTDHEVFIIKLGERMKGGEE